MPDPPRLYTDLARLWPHLSPPDHYAAEANAVADLIDQALGPPPADQRWSVLELGAGGGHTLHHFADRFDCVAADLSPPMLDHCKALNPAVPTVLGDMRDLRLDQRFDAVLIHDAVDYMLTQPDAAAACDTAAAHLRPGGLAIIAPTYTTQTFVNGDVADDGTTIPGIAGDEELTYFTFVHDPDPADTQFEMILLYLLRDPQTRQVQVIEDRHTCGLFSVEQWCAMMQAAGLDTEPLLTAPAQDADQNDLSGWSTVFLGAKP
ncbi:MAG: class I SAM-dependent methyltransferase [Planctomycetota bacterium]